MRVNDMFRYQNVSLPEDILRRKYYGDFEGAIRLIDLRLQDERLPEALHYAMQVHREMMMRMPMTSPRNFWNSVCGCAIRTAPITVGACWQAFIRRTLCPPAQS